MSGRPNTPLLAPARAARLLDDVIFTRVAELIDLPRLYDLEAMLALQIANLGAATGAPAEDADHARAIAKAMIDRALLRVARTTRRWTRGASPGGEGACDICGSPCDAEEQSPDHHTSAARDSS